MFQDKKNDVQQSLLSNAKDLVVPPIDARAGANNLRQLQLGLMFDDLIREVGRRMTGNGPFVPLPPKLEK